MSSSSYVCISPCPSKVGIFPILIHLSNGAVFGCKATVQLGILLCLTEHSGTTYNTLPSLGHFSFRTSMPNVWVKCYTIVVSDTPTQMEYAIELTYCVAITTIKFSILLFYRRVFINQTTSKNFIVAWYVITVWCFLWGISTFFAAAFQCTPVSYGWTQFTGKTKGKCLDFTALLLSTAIINICTDVAVLVLPMPLVWNLKIEKSQKFAVSGIFLLGSL